jgi:exodeoxyribonuclease-5
MGSNEEIWPVVVQANGLLPVSAQRMAGVLAVSPSLQMAQALEQRRLLLQAAPDLMFSWARQSTARELAPSPLIRDFEVTEYVMPPAVVTESSLQYLLDAKAPPVADGEVVRGGTWLIQAQSVCPAWSFYRYRLGAAVLPAPTFGLDARGRGLSLHGALEAFWRGRCQADVVAMSVEARQEAIRIAVSTALDLLDAHAAEPMPPRFRALESERLIRLLLAWLEVEMRRPSFRVIACEERHSLEIEGLPVRVVIDRIDELQERPGGQHRELVR